MRLAIGGNDPGLPYLVACADNTRGARRANGEPGHFGYAVLPPQRVPAFLAREETVRGEEDA